MGASYRFTHRMGKFMVQRVKIQTLGSLFVQYMANLFIYLSKFENSNVVGFLCDGISNTEIERFLTWPVNSW